MSNQEIPKNCCLNEILDAGILAGNQLPDIFWKLDITGKELQVLRYVWSHIVRLHKTVRTAPRGRDGSPRYWKDKEKMAADCKMACQTFRYAVRSLYKQGLTTSMDGIDDLEKVLTIDDMTHCIGLNPKFFVRLKIPFRPDLNRKSREYMLHLINDICPFLYDKNTVQLIRDNVMKLLELEDKVMKELLSKKNVSSSDFSRNHQEKSEDTKDNLAEVVDKGERLKPNLEDAPKIQIGYVQYYDDGTIEPWYAFTECPEGCREVVLEDGATIVIDKYANRTPIKVTRTPFFVHRVANNDLSRKERSERMMKKILQERDRLFVLTAKEQKIMDVVHYYEYKCRVVTGNSGWRSLGRNFRKHRNWQHFIRIFDLCQENDWDYKVYIDSQFDRARYWTHKDCKGYPYPNQFFSEKAIRYFHKYQEDYRQRYSVTGTAKVKVSKAMPYQDEVIDAVIKDCDHFIDFFKVAPKQRKYRGLTAEQMKFGYIIDHVASLSQYYWASLPWAVSYLKRFTTPWVQELTATVERIQSSKSMMKTINLVVKEVENQLGIPHTILPGVD